jgi:hypothetical protein
MPLAFIFITTSRSWDSGFSSAIVHHRTAASRLHFHNATPVHISGNSLTAFALVTGQFAVFVQVGFFFINLHLRNLLDFFAAFFGCFENCFPFLVSARFLRVVAAYSLSDMALIAFSGKYLSPVALGP